MVKSDLGSTIVYIHSVHITDDIIMSVAQISSLFLSPV